MGCMFTDPAPTRPFLFSKNGILANSFRGNVAYRGRLSATWRTERAFRPAPPVRCRCYGVVRSATMPEAACCLAQSVYSTRSWGSSLSPVLASSICWNGRRYDTPQYSISSTSAERSREKRDAWIRCSPKSLTYAQARQHFQAAPAQLAVVAAGLGRLERAFEFLCVFL